MKERKNLKKNLFEYSDTLTDLPGFTKTIQHDIIIRDEAQFKLSQSYPIPYSLEPQLHHELQICLDLGVIGLPKSSYCSPLLAVCKKDGTHRFCLDCRSLNQQTVFDAEPIEETKSIFSKFDLTSGYWQVSTCNT